ncbi:hypothetical protein BCR37DRAFT_381970 [Protomyces lactucae-debilis]|uniref:Integral membrane protein n=1 Tax=Protomyces lactucae-debilis TaxID=2754530 RepID=A0A1Y2F566_PROLT|nr:uncharacterized protein BCR37DRAFT_381970 [Protomyces lactucae-debilis]ORY79001.1 hypothetical protein BCR37DRAFT_381970 [Protomyces lactucae-debilis]
MFTLANRVSIPCKTYGRLVHHLELGPVRDGLALCCSDTIGTTCNSGGRALSICDGQALLLVTSIKKTLAATFMVFNRTMSLGSGAGLSQRFVDENISSLLVGWCIALITLVVFRICVKGRLSHFVYLCIALLVVSAALALVSWIYQMGQLFAGYSVTVAFVVLWSLQAQIYFQIVPFRICVLGLANPWVLRISIAVLIGSINITMLALWPAAKWRRPNDPVAFWLPRAEKIGYLLLDVALNVLFLVTVKSKLVDVGLSKYGKLITYNIKIIGLSILCDLLLLASMWYPKNSFLFILVHPVVFLNKLILERAITHKMAMVSQEDIGWTARISLSTVLKRASKHLSRHSTALDSDAETIDIETVTVCAEKGRRGAFSLPSPAFLELDKDLPTRPLDLSKH